MGTYQQLMYERRDEIKERILAGEKFADIGKEFGCRGGTVHYFYKRHCCGESPGLSNYGIVEKNKDKIIQLFEENNSCSKIGQLLDMDHSMIARGLKKWGYDPSIRLCRDPNNLLKDRVDDVLLLHKKGMRAGQIARKLGYAPSCVRDVLRNSNKENTTRSPIY